MRQDQRPRKGATVVPIAGNPQRHELQIRTTPVIPDGLEFQYCDGIEVTSTQHEFVVSLMQVQHPLITQPLEPDEIKNFVVYSKVIARVIVAPDRIPGFIKSLQDSLDLHRIRYHSELSAGEANQMADNAESVPGIIDASESS